MRPEQQAYVVALSERLARFAPTKVLLEYTDDADEKINRRYRDYVAGKFELGKNEIYQVGFRVAKLMGHKRGPPGVHGFHSIRATGETRDEDRHHFIPRDLTQQPFER